MKRAPRISRRRRISNQLAAFAAVMLFASTQVNAPVGDESGAATSSPVASRQADADRDSVADPAISPTSDVMPRAVSSRRTKARGINLNLFLFRP